MSWSDKFEDQYEGTLNHFEEIKKLSKDNPDFLKLLQNIGKK
jgi:hypothetical protein